ncbi:hypothetical protein P168DRAFT_231762 [Aspergillus campestris IBT 28561]|uniref:Uncharacterized protein n=1 Tax=Aspergillus campestris (strain IBT 28561) TaxID=1392248 RepID=A0A2I1D8N6_ASPC2|nr:uncharacterized protein P168DRAFT_231762 [Aspergillus campestris IBT 28561]PKY06236.1 hypothetical protein P168DRAFT_231762 [Aspergillus campestris IBT 28561]
MLQDLEHPSITPTPATDVPKPPPTKVSPVDNLQHSLSYDDQLLSHRVTPAASLAQCSDTASPQPEKQIAPIPNPSFHRRANTEFLHRQPPAPARHLVATQPRALEDIDAADTRPNPPGNVTRKKLEQGAKRLSDWFQGNSDPVNLGLVYQPGNRETHHDHNMDRRNSHDIYGSPTTLTMNRTQKRMTAPSPLKQVASTGPLSLFGLKRQERTELPVPAEDEFLNMDVTAALFPPGSAELDEHEAFLALRNNASNVLRSLQSAYKQRTFALHEVLAERVEKQEELEETRTRVGHLKLQLDGMAERVLQQDKEMKAMAEELEQERQLRRRDDEARRRSIMLVRSSDDDSTSDLGADLQAPKRSLKRNSNATFTSDSGFDSGDESLAESVFSRREGLESPTSTVAPSPNISQIALSPPSTAYLQASPKETKPATLSAPPRPSAYDRVLKGLSWGNSASKCTICYGVPASEAWSVMGVLKEENRGLKGRLGELEMVIDDCLSMVGP